MFCPLIMAFKICVLLITIFLLQNGQTFRLNGDSDDEIDEGTVRMIQDAFIEKYPQAAIDKYITVLRQLHSKVPEERKDGNFESVVLLVEGALYRTELSDNPRQYDVRSALKRIDDDASDSDEDDFNETTLAAMKADLDKEFPSEVGQTIANILTKVLKALTLKQSKKAAIELITLSMDGARAITSRFQTLPAKTI